MCTSSSLCVFVLTVFVYLVEDNVFACTAAFENDDKNQFSAFQAFKFINIERFIDIHLHAFSCRRSESYSLHTKGEKN